MATTSFAARALVLCLLLTAACSERGPEVPEAPEQPARAAAALVASEEACAAEPDAQPSTLVYVGASRATYGERVLLAAVLTDASGHPLEGRQVRLALGGLEASRVTDASGLVMADVLPAGPAGELDARATFAGDSDHGPATVQVPFVLERAATRLRLTASAHAASSSAQPLVARLQRLDDGQPVVGRTLTFSAGSFHASALTDAAGEARVTLPAGAPTGMLAVEASFGGDGFYVPSQDALQVLRYLPTRFSVWGGNTPGLKLGDRVNFWGHSWPMQVTGGDYAAQGDFKGWAAGSTAFALCQPDARTAGVPALTPGCWTSKTGNSFPVPSTLPEYIGVLVTTAVDKRQGELFGNVAALAVVKVAPSPAYGPVPGKAGFGTLVAVVEGGRAGLPVPTQLVASQSQPAMVWPGEVFKVQLDVVNTAGGTAGDVSASERFVGSTPETDGATLGSLAAGSALTHAFTQTSPVQAPRADGESEVAYQARLAEADGQRLGAHGTVRFTDATGVPTRPLEVHSQGKVRLPRLFLGLTVARCAQPCSQVRYEVTATNLGWGRARGVTATVTLPDGTPRVVELGALEPGLSTSGLVEFQLPEVAARGANESREAYLERLRALDGMAYTARADLAWTDPQGNAYGPLTRTASTTTRLPVLGVSAERPLGVLPGETFTATFTVANFGSAPVLDAQLAVEGAAPVTPFALAPGASVTVPVQLTAPPVAPRGQGEGEAAYLARLRAADRQQLSYPFALSWEATCAARFGPVDGTLRTTRVLPAVTVSLQGPAEATAGDTLAYVARLENVGSVEAHGAVLTAVLPGGQEQPVALPPGALARGGALSVPFSVALPAATPPGTFTLGVRLTWADARANVYGPLGARVDTLVRQTNAPPVVDAGPDRTVTLPYAATLAGSVTDDGKPAPVSHNWVQVGGPATATLSQSGALSTQAVFTQVGDYTFRLVGTDSEFTAHDEMVVHVLPREGSGTTLPGSDPVPGEDIINVVRDESSMRLDDTTQPFNFIWVAVSSKGTVVKLDTATGKVLGEYWTAPSNESKDPSRTTVDKNGSVWATNRANNSVVHIGLLENGQCDDRNLNGVIETSTGYGDVRAWGSAASTDDNAAVKVAEDECILHYVKVRSSGTRHVSVNEDNDVWVSGTGGRHFDLIDGSTGVIKRRENAVSGGYGGYGGLIDRKGVIWSSRNLLRWDTAKPLTGIIGVNWQGWGHDSYGLCLDPYGNVWNTELSGGYIRKFAPDGTLLGTYYHGEYYAQGCVASPDGDIWVAHSLYRGTVGHLKNDGRHVGNVAVRSGPTGVAVDGAGRVWATNHNSRTVSRIDPTKGALWSGDGKTRVGEEDLVTRDLGGALYNYSDMTGSTLSGAPDSGTWSYVYDSGKAGSVWGKVAWQGAACGDASLKVSVQSSQSAAGPFSTPVVVKSGVDFDVPHGRFLKVSVSFKRSAKGESPILYNLSVGTEGYVVEAPLNAALSVSAGRDRGVTQPNVARLTGSACDDAQPSGGPLALTWAQVSGPGTATFAPTDKEATDVTFSAPGTYVLRLTASDGVHTASDETHVTVEPLNLPPQVAIVAPSALVLPEAAMLVGTVSDDGLPVGGSLTRAWAQVSGPGTVTFSSSATGSTSASFSQAGTYVLRLTVSDGHLTRSAEESVVVSPAPSSNLPPVVSAGPNLALNFGAQVNLAGSVQDDGLPLGKAVTQSWTKVSGPGSVSFTTPTATATRATFSLAGTYVLRLTATDTEQSSSSDVSVVLAPALPANRAPSVSISATQSGTSGLQLSLTGSVSDDGLPSGAVLTRQWSHVSGPAPVTFSAPTGNTTLATFTQAGTYVLRLSASDTQLTTSADVQVAVNTTAPANAAPQVSAGTNAAITLPSNTVQLNGTVSDDGRPSGAALSTQWTQVSGPGQAVFSSPGTAATQASFPVAGTYVLRLSASDSQLERASDVSVVVHPAASPNAPPVVAAGPNLSTVLPQDTVQLQGSASDDGLPQGSALAVSWTRESGPGTVTFGDASAPATTARFSAAGTYKLRLTARDSAFASWAEMIVVVYAAAPENAAPVVSVGPSRTLTLPTRTTSFSATVTDDGLPTTALTYQWTKVSGPDGLVFTAPTQKATSVSVTQAGTYQLRLTASDSRLAGSADATLTVLPEGEPNQPPTIDPGPNLQVMQPANAVTLAGTVTDDGRPAGGALAVEWRKVSGPGTVTFANPASASTTAAFSTTGDYVLELSASDGEWVGFASMGVRVTPYVENQPPQVAASGLAQVTLPAAAQLSGSARDDGLPASSTLALSWTRVSGPGTVTFSRPTQASTSASFSGPGEYVLRFTADDGDKSASADVSVTVLQVNRAPDVSAGPPQTLAHPQRVAQLTGRASDDGLPQGSTVQVTWSVAGGAGGVTFADAASAATQVTFTHPGSYLLRLTATDGVKSAFADTVVEVGAPDGALPQVALSSPADGATIKGITPITGTVSEGNWRVEACPGAPGATPSSECTVLGAGEGAVAGGTLATFDPSTLLNGTYSVQVVATTSAGTTTSSRVAVVEGDLKLGNFSVSFTDLSVPVMGLPIELVRTYDSRDKQRGDFGHGWNLAVRNVRVQKSGKLGRGWEQYRTSGFFPNWCMQPTKPNFVTITFPSGKVYRFRTTTAPECQFVYPIQTVDLAFKPEAGTNGELVAYGSDGLYVHAESGLPGPVMLTGFDLEPADFHAFKLTTEDGTVYDIDEEGGVRSVRDPNGNSLVFTDNGIAHSSGKSVTFERDSLGRITRITDPNGASLLYAYDARGDLVKVTDRDSQATTFGYAGTHHLVSIKDPAGRQPIRNEYDATGRLVSHTDAAGKTITYTHRPDARQEVVTDRLGLSRVLEYDSDGNVVRETNSDGHTSVRTFDARGNALSETDPLGHVQRFTYDRFDNVTSETDPLGHVTARTWGPRQQLLTETDPLGRVTRQEYDLKGNLVAITDAAGHVTRQTYSDRGVPQTRTDPLGCVTRYTFDSDGRLLEERDAVGLVAKSTYDANGNVLSRTVAQPPPSEAPQLTTFFAYDAVGRPTRTTEPDGAVTQVRYSAAGEETEREDPLGRVTRREYDAFGRPYRTFFPDQTYTEQSFDAEGRLVAERDRAGRLTRYTLNGEGRITAVEFPDGTRTAHSWDAAGRLVATVDAAGATTHYAYDAAGRRTKVTDALGRVTRFGYDAVGNVVSVVDPAGRTTRYEYDALDRRVRTLFPDGTETRTAYDAVGNKVLEVDAEGRETRFSYDCRGRLTGVQDPAGGLTTYTYDARNLRTSMTDAAGRTTRYVYDSRGREVSRILPTGEADTRVYDAAGNLVQRTGFGGASTHFSYDTNDRLVERSRPDGTSVRFTYTATGRRLSAVDARGTTHYTYDARDRLLKVEQPGAGALSYAYEARGQRTRLAAQVGGEEYVTTYSYDAVGRLAGVVDDLGRPYALGYDANGNRASLAYPNGVTTRYGYDTRNRLTQLTSSRADGQVVQGYTFTLSGAGQRMRVDEVDGTTHTYTYDSLRRLTSETVVGPAGAYQHAFVYDAVGNRIRQVRTEAGGMTTREATFDTRDRVLSEGDTAFGWNADGQLTSRSGSEEAGFEWDFEERLRRVVHADGRVTEHVYDADGNRVELRETPAGGGPVRVTRYLVDTAGPLSHVVAELDASGQVRAHYTRADDELLAVLRPGGSRFFHADGVGSVRRLTDETGFVTDAYRFSAFGELREHTGADPNTYRFAGEPVDPNTGFSFNRARWLNPQAGQFVSMDPYAGTLADPPSLHRYLYAHADPVNNVDPTGQFAVPASIVNLSISVSVAAMSCYNGLLAAFRTGGPAVGRAFQAFGALAERTAQTVIRTWNPNAVTQGLHIAGRHIDNVLRIGNRIMMLEVKYSLPRAGDALTRLTAQANAMLTHPGVASGRAQAVVWSYKEPTQAAMRDVLSALGPAASRVQFVHGVEGLYRYLVLYFGNGPF